MPRTPLLRTLLRTLHSVHVSRRLKLPLGEHPPHKALTRRDLLAAASAASLLACVRRNPLPSSEEHGVVIVGAGMAGVHCAYRLKALGIQSTLVDAAPRAGGRMFTLRGAFPDGQHCELGAELIDTPHQTMRDLASELSLELLDYGEDDAALKKQGVFLDGAWLSEQALLEGACVLSERIELALRTLKDPHATITYKNPNGAEALDRLSLREWLDQQGLGRDPIRRLVELAYTAELGLEADQVSALGMLQMISSGCKELLIFGDSDERFHTQAGNDTYLQKMLAALPPPMLGHQLVAIHPQSDGRQRLVFHRGPTTYELSAEHVVLALPFSLLRKVEIGTPLPPQKQRAIRELGYATNAKLMVGYGERTWRKLGFDGTTFADLPYQTSWETSRLQPGASGIITNFTGGRRGVHLGQGTPEEQARDFVQQFDQAFPGSAVAFTGQSARMHWPSYPFTQGSYGAYLPGQYTAFCGSEIERVGNLYFCGEHTSLDAQGFMEGAALTGAMAAVEVAAAIGVPVHAPHAPAARILRRASLAIAHGSWIDASTRARNRKDTAA